MLAKDNQDFKERFKKRQKIEKNMIQSVTAIQIDKRFRQIFVYTSFQCFQYFYKIGQ